MRINFLIPVLLGLIAAVPSAHGQTQFQQKVYPAAENFTNSRVHITPRPTNALASPSLSLKAPRAWGAPEFKTPSTDSPTIYGSLIFSSQWTVDKSDEGIYSFPATTGCKPTPVHLAHLLNANGGGTYYNGRYYMLNWFDSYGARFAYFRIFDADTWEPIVSHRVENTSIGTDITYDRSTESIYGCFLNATGDGYVLGRMSMTDGAVTALADLMEPFFTLAANAEGELFAITQEGNLNKINKSTGAKEVVGNTGLVPTYSQSMTFDMKTGRLYWAACTAGGCGLYEVNTQTAAITHISTFDYNEEFAGIFIPSDGAAAAAPGELIDFTADYVTTSSSDIAVSFTLPRNSFDGKPLSGTLTYTIRLNDVDMEVGEGTPGEKVNYTLQNASVGYGNVSAFAENSAGASPQSRVKKWFGADAPKAVRNLTVKPDGSKITIEWDTPDGTVHDGYMNFADINYNIVRQPGNVTVCQRTTDNTFTDNVDTERLTHYYYEVTSFNGTLRGTTATSGRIIVGDALSLPFSESFDSSSDFDLFTVIDANADGKTWFLDSGTAKCGYSMSVSMDDWLITPPLKMDTEHIYTIRFKAKTFGYKETFAVYIGTQPTVEGMTRDIIPSTTFLNNSFQEFKCNTTVSSDGAHYIGIHKTSPKECFNLFIDDLEIIQAASVKAPDAINDLTIIPASDGTLSATVRFTAPTKSVNGIPLTSLTKIYLYKGNKIVKTFMNPAPGSECVVENIPCDAGFNEFRTVPSNSEGNGLDTSASKFIGPDLPGRANNIKLVEENGKAVLTWDAPDHGINGGFIDQPNLRYHIAAQDYTHGGTQVKAMNLTERRFEEVPSLSDIQGMVSYYVYCVNSVGVGEGWRSNVIIMGTPYALPFKESFAGNNSRYNTWRFENEADDQSQWGIASSGVYPSTNPVDDDGGMLSFQPGVEGSASVLTSGRIAMKDATAPTLEFYYYFKRNCTDKITVKVAENGVDFTDIHTIDMAAENGSSGWRKVSVPLTRYAGKEAIQFGIRVQAGDDLSSIHFDNFVIRNIPEYDLAVSDFKTPAPFTLGNEASFKVTVANMGSKTADSYTVELIRSGKPAASANGTDLKPGETKTFEFKQTPDLSFGNKVEYYGHVAFVQDQNSENDNSMVKNVTVVTPNLPVVSDLDGSINAEARTATLFWTEPDLTSAQRVEDDFDSYDSFLISGIGDWYTVDRDRGETVYISGVDMWPNCSYPQAYIVFNPKEAKVDEPNPDGTPSMFTPHSGDQMLISFASYAGQNDDWLISPRLNGKAQEVTFYIKSLTSYYGLETWEFLISNDSYRENLTEFKPMDGIGGEAPEEWTKVTVSVPESTRYFAIRCTSTDRYGLCIDDVAYTPAPASEFTFKGYDVYCNDVRLTQTPITATSYTHQDVDPDGAYKYNVVCVFDKGMSAYSNDCLLGSSAIDDIESGHVLIHTVNGGIVIEGAAGQRFTVHSIQGIAIASGIAAPTTSVELSNGVYVVTVGRNHHKVLVK